MIDLTIAIPTLNEEQNVAKCLNAIGNDFAAKIVIIDSKSNDKTTSIAKEYGAEIQIFVWNGKYPKKRNWYLTNHTPKTKWVLFLDVDEIITENFKKEVTRLLPTTGHVAFELIYTRYFLGRRLKGGYPLKKTALFKVGSAMYEYVNENRWSKCDMEVHEHPMVNGSIGMIKSTINHHDDRSIENYIHKHNEYASWEANRLFQARKDNYKIRKYNKKKYVKYLILSSHYSGIIYFLGSYILMGGWKDGKIGLVFATLKAGYFTQIFCKLEELERKEKLRSINEED